MDNNYTYNLDPLVCVCGGGGGGGDGQVFCVLGS